MKCVVYIHGFNSSSASFKAGVLEKELGAIGLAMKFFCPDLHHVPSKAIKVIHETIADYRTQDVVLVGSSLGGFYASYLTSVFGYQSILINPAIQPHVGLSDYLGTQKNLYSGVEYEFTDQHLRELEGMYITDFDHIEKAFLIHTTGDELLDWKIAMRRYEGAKRLIVQGSDHGFSNFADYVEVVSDYITRNFLLHGHN